jgi:hypothetical protein
MTTDHSVDTKIPASGNFGNDADRLHSCPQAATPGRAMRLARLSCLERHARDGISQLRLSPRGLANHVFSLSISAFHRRGEASFPLGKMAVVAI